MKITTSNRILPRKLPEDEDVINFADEDDEDIEVIIASKLEHFMYFNVETDSESKVTFNFKAQVER